MSVSYVVVLKKYYFVFLAADSSKKESKKKVHEEVIAEDYDTSKEEISQIDIAQKFMVCS